MEKEWFYRREYYTDEEESLKQAFMISKREIIDTCGEALVFARKNIHPDLTWNYKDDYLNSRMRLIRTEYYDKDGYCYKTEEPTKKKKTTKKKKVENKKGE